MKSKLISSQGNVSLINVLIFLLNRKLIIIGISLIFSITYVLLNINKTPLYKHSINFTPNLLSSDNINISSFRDHKINLDNTEDLKKNNILFFSELKSNLENVEILKKTLLQVITEDDDNNAYDIDKNFHAIVNRLKGDKDNDNFFYDFTYQLNDKISDKFLNQLIQNAYLYILENKEKRLIEKQNNNQIYLNDLTQEALIEDKNLIKKLDFKIQELKAEFELNRINKLTRIKEAIELAREAEIYEPIINDFVSMRGGSIFDEGIPLFTFGTNVLTKTQDIIKSNNDGYKMEINYLKLINLKFTAENNNHLAVRYHGPEKLSTEIENYRLMNQLNKIKLDKEKNFLDDIVGDYTSTIKEINTFKIFNVVIVQLAGLIIGALLVIINRVFRENS